MNSNGEICIGMAGAGRAAELHVAGLKRYSGVPVCLKTIVDCIPEQALKAQERFGFQKACADLDDVLKDDEIDVVDICTPPYVHEEMVVAALRAGKHVICEKPFCGYFGRPGDEAPIGLKVSKVAMYDAVMESLERLKDVIEGSGRKFMYAENFIYAPAIRKAGEIISKKKSRILYAKGEESLKGSSSPVAGEWAKTGGGTFIRTGVHPLSAILWLKRQEAAARGVDIGVKSVLADMGRVTTSLSPYEHRHIAARPVDVEDNGTVVVSFTDGSKAVVIATDTLLGGSRNYVELYCNDAAINCTLTMSNAMSTYFLDEDRLDDVYISEMLPSKTGWNNPFLEDEIMRGYTDEMRDFMDAVCHDREPRSGLEIAYDTTRITYAAYKSAELGAEVNLL